MSYSSKPLPRQNDGAKDHIEFESIFQDRYQQGHKYMSFIGRYPNMTIFRGPSQKQFELGWEMARLTKRVFGPFEIAVSGDVTIVAIEK